jgi:anthranilate synthase/aminodeoxychorismate synthase-like glutamine amidotransferase
MIVIIDNYDSFVHNLARYFRECGAQPKIIRNDAVTAGDCLALAPRAIVVSPGPKTPGEAGVSLELIKAMPPDMAFLGVCLGHQCLVEAFGGKTVRAKHPLHGEASMIRHMGTGIFEGVASPTPAGRYHSLTSLLPTGSALVEAAWSEEGEVMAVAHCKRPWFGVQFHPESLLTPQGRVMINNFLRYC